MGNNRWLETALDFMDYIKRTREYEVLAREVEGVVLGIIGRISSKTIQISGLSP